MIAQAERTLWRRSDRRLQENIDSLVKTRFEEVPAI